MTGRLTLIVDASPLVAQAEPVHPFKQAARRFLLESASTLVVSPLVVAEVDHLMVARAGAGGSRPFMADLARGRYVVPCLETADFKSMADLNERYRDLNVGLTDLSIVVLAHRYNTRRVLTFDQRHFRLLRTLDGGSFTLLPFDEDDS